MSNSHIDVAKRHSLKMVAGLGVAGLTGTASVFADQNNLSSVLSKNTETQTLNCTLISQPGLTDAHLLIDNPNANDVAVARFASNTISFDGTVAHCADAYVEPVVVPANQTVMVRFKLDLDQQAKFDGADLVDLDSSTNFLPMGTRVASFNVDVRHGVANTVTPAKAVQFS